jgi:curved DNA-binding protein CbpA
VSSKNFYQLLGIAPTSGFDEIKRAFRFQIARYHPDKVQHLGEEFQEMAAILASELTEAYRILSDEQRRSEYDRSLASHEPPAASAAPASPPGAVPFQAARAATPPPPSPVDEPAPARRDPFSHERAKRDQVLRRATFIRFRQALDAVGGGYDQSEARGFDFAWLPKSRLFGRSSGPRLVGRLVPRVDRETVDLAWADARKCAQNEDVCVFLMGTDLAPAGELARAIADRRRRPRSSRVTLIPVDARTWDAHLPTDAPAIVKTVLARLKTGT